MNTSRWTKGILAAVVLCGVSFAVLPAAAETISGSYWYAVDNITSIDEGTRFLVWVTLPAQWHGQKVNVTGIEPDPVNVYLDEESGNKVMEWIWEPEKWEMMPATEPRHFFFKYDFILEELPVRNEFDPDLVGEFDRASDLYKSYTSAATWIQTDGPTRDMALKIVGQEKNPGLQARLIFDWILENLTFVPGGEGKRDAASVLAGLRGDCGQFSTLFTAMCRSVGIPARNVSLVWRGGGLHDFNEIYLPGYGWFPVDTSLAQMLLPYRSGMTFEEVEGVMTPLNVPLGDPYYLFGNLPDNRMILTKGLNVRFDSPTMNKQILLQRMRPGGVDAFPQGYEIRGFNSTVVHGGFHVFGGEPIDDEMAHALTHQRLAGSFFDEGLDVMVEDGCRPSVAKYSDGGQTWVNLGKVYMHKGEYYKAEAAFKRALKGFEYTRHEQAELLIWAHNYLGNCYDIMGHREMAKSEYEAVVEQGDNFRGAVDYARKYLGRPFKKEALQD